MSQRLPRLEMTCGAVFGLAWASSMRAFMAIVAESDGGSRFSWATFVFLLAPGLVVGALMGWAVAPPHPDTRPAPQGLRWAPMGMSLDPFALPLNLAVIGAGWLLAGRATAKSRWWIGVPSTLMLSALPIAMLFPPDPAWRSLHGMWLLIMASSLLACYVIAETAVVRCLTSADARLVEAPSVRWRSRRVT